MYIYTEFIFGPPFKRWTITESQAMYIYAEFIFGPPFRRWTITESLWSLWWVNHFGPWKACDRLIVPSALTWQSRKCQKRASAFQKGKAQLFTFSLSNCLINKRRKPGLTPALDICLALPFSGVLPFWVMALGFALLSHAKPTGGVFVCEGGSQWRKWGTNESSILLDENVKSDLCCREESPSNKCWVCEQSSLIPDWSCSLRLTPKMLPWGLEHLL